MRDLRSVENPSKEADELPGRARKKDEEPGKKPEPVQRTAYAKYSDGTEDSFYIPPVSKDKKHTKSHTLDGDGETGRSAEISDPSPTGNDQKTPPPVSVPETASNGQQTEGHPSTQKQTQETLLVRKNSPLDVANVLEAMFDFATFRDQLYRYEEANGFWKLIPESEANRELRRLIPEEFANSVNKSALAEIYEWLLVRAISMGEDDEARRFFLNFADCAVDWRTKTVINRRKNLFFRSCLPIRYRELPFASTGAYSAFLDDVFGDDEETRKEFNKFIGLCLSDIRDLKLCFFLFGPSHTGKSIVLNLLKRLVGEEYCSSLSFSQMSSEFAVTQLLGKRLNLSGEVSGASNKRLDIFKSITGNDTVTACYKGKDHFQFSPEAMLVFACNDFPAIPVTTEVDSVLARLIIFPFKNVKPRAEWKENLEDALLEDCGAIVQAAISGLQTLYRMGFVFHETEAMRDAKQEFTGCYNSFALFAELYLEKAPNMVTLSRDIVDKYRLFCREEDYTVLPDNIWSLLLMREFGCRKVTRTIDVAGEKTRVRAYAGVKLKNPEDSDDYLIDRRYYHESK